MKTFRKTMLVVFAALLLAACDKDAGQTANSGEASPEGGKVEMRFGFSASEQGSPLASVPAADPAGPDDWESALRNLWVLQFDGQGADAGMVLCEYYPADRIQDNTVSVALFETASTRVYFVANVGAGRFGALASDTTLGAFEAMSLDFADETAVKAGNALPMVGVYEGSATAATATVSLTRMVAKVTFTCKVNIMAPSESFTINRIRLRSAAAKALYKAPAVPTAQTGLFPDGSSSDNFFDYAEAEASADADGKVTAVWYMPENLRGVVAGLTEKTKGGDNVPTGSTCIEVSGDYAKGDALYDVTYRIYPGQNASTDFNMIRNYKYGITSTIKGFSEQDLRVVVEKGVDAGKYVDGEW